MGYSELVWFGTRMIEIESSSGYVPAGRQGGNEEHEDEGNRVEEVLRLVQDRKGCVAEESNVDVVTSRQKPNGVAEEYREERGRIDQS